MGIGGRNINVDVANIPSDDINNNLYIVYSVNIVSLVNYFALNSLRPFVKWHIEAYAGIACTFHVDTFNTRHACTYFRQVGHHSILTGVTLDMFAIIMTDPLSLSVSL